MASGRLAGTRRRCAACVSPLRPRAACTRRSARRTCTPRRCTCSTRRSSSWASSRRLGRSIAAYRRACCPPSSGGPSPRTARAAARASTRGAPSRPAGARTQTPATARPPPSRRACSRSSLTSRPSERTRHARVEPAAASRARVSPFGRGSAAALRASSGSASAPSTASRAPSTAAKVFTPAHHSSRGHRLVRRRRHPLSPLPVRFHRYPDEHESAWPPLTGLATHGATVDGGCLLVELTPSLPGGRGLVDVERSSLEERLAAERRR